MKNLLLKNMQLNSLLLLIGLCFAVGKANAAIIPTGVDGVLVEVDTSGTEPSLIGARNLDVFGTGELYDVRFVDGSFTDIFVDESGLDATDIVTARLFGRALLDFVLLDLPVGNFDSIPTLTAGCDLPFSCGIAIPYVFGSVPFVSFSDEVLDFITVSNNGGNTDDFVAGTRTRRFFGLDTVGLNTTFADFSLSAAADSTTQPVPEPSAIMLILPALIALFTFRRRRSQHTHMNAVSA